jgi:hypothetical protein
MTIRSDLEAARAVIKRDGFSPYLSGGRCPTCFYGAIRRAVPIQETWGRGVALTHLREFVPLREGVPAPMTFSEDNLRTINTPAALAILDRAIAACGDTHG